MQTHTLSTPLSTLQGQGTSTPLTRAISSNLRGGTNLKLEQFSDRHPRYYQNVAQRYHDELRSFQTQLAFEFPDTSDPRCKDELDKLSSKKEEAINDYQLEKNPGQKALHFAKANMVLAFEKAIEYGQVSPLALTPMELAKQLLRDVLPEYIEKYIRENSQEPLINYFIKNLKVKLQWSKSKTEVELTRLAILLVSKGNIALPHKALMYYANPEDITLIDGTVFTQPEQRGLMDLHGGAEGFCQHMQPLIEHERVLATATTIEPNTFFVMIVERILKDNNRLPSGGVDYAFLDKKATAWISHKHKRTDLSPAKEESIIDMGGSLWSSPVEEIKTFTLRDLILDGPRKYIRYKEAQLEKTNSNHDYRLNIERTQFQDPILRGLESALTGINIEGEYTALIDRFKSTPEFMDALQHRFKSQLYQRIFELGGKTEQLLSVNVDHQPRAVSLSRGFRSMNSVFGLRNDNGSFTFFSLITDDTFTTTSRTETESGTEAYRWLRDKDHAFSQFISEHIDPKQRHDPSGYELRIDLFEHQYEDRILKKHTENYMNFLKNWMDLNATDTEGERALKAITFWVNEIGKAWAILTDWLPPHLKFLARVGFAALKGALNMASAETEAERDQHGRNMGYEMGMAGLHTSVGYFSAPVSKVVNTVNGKLPIITSIKGPEGLSITNHMQGTFSNTKPEDITSSDSPYLSPCDKSSPIWTRIINVRMPESIQA